jgi:hypothetical protein
VGVTGVDHDQREAAFEHFVDGPPVNAGGFHGDVGDPQLMQPLGQLQQVGRGGAKLLVMSLPPAFRRGDPDADAHRLLVNIQSRAMCIQNLHNNLSFFRWVSRPPAKEAFLVFMFGLYPACSTLDEREWQHRAVPDGTLGAIFFADSWHQDYAAIAFANGLAPTISFHPAWCRRKRRHGIFFLKPLSVTLPYAARFTIAGDSAAVREVHSTVSES